MRKLTCWMVGGLLLGGCGSCGSLARRYDTVLENTSRTDKRVEVYVFVTEPPAAPGQTRTAFELAAPAQQALIEQAAKNAAQGEAMGAVQAALRTPLPVTQASGLRTDVSRSNPRLVFTLVHRPFIGARYAPASRIAWSEITLELCDDDVSFVGYDKIDTGYEVVDLGKLTRSVNWNLSATSGLTGSRSRAETREGEEDSTKTEVGVSTPASATASVGGSAGEEVALRKRYVQLAAWISDNGRKLHLIREGASGIDLTGSTVIDAVLQGKRKTTQVMQFSPPTAGGQATFLVRDLIYSSVAEVAMRVSAAAVVRDVVVHDDTLSEDDDEVAFKWSTAEPQTVTHAFQHVGLYRIRNASKVVLKASKPDERPIDVVFRSLGEAEAFRVWIESNRDTAAAFEQHNQDGYRLHVPAGELAVIDQASLGQTGVQKACHSPAVAP